MRIRCPACQAVHELDVEPLPGQNIECLCGRKFPFGPEVVCTSSAPAAAACQRCQTPLDPAGLTPGEPALCPACRSRTPDATPTVALSGPPPLPRPPPGLAPGTVLGRCRVERELGAGAMGAVYLAHHTTLDIPVAVKVMLPECAARPAFKERFMREAQTAARLNDPNVVRVLDCGDEGGVLYFVMEYVAGGSVKQMQQERGRLDVATVLAIGTAVARALVAAARHQIVHRDIKPDNIMRTADGVYKLADLGLAKQITEGAGAADLTVASVSMGTPYYMSPEQALDARACDARTDTYSLGATLYHLLCGRPPFTGKTTLEILRGHAAGTCEAPSQVDPTIPAGFDTVLGKALMKNPADRYQSAAALLADLEALQAGPAVPAAAAAAGAQPQSPAAKALRRRRWKWVALGVLGLVIIGGIANQAPRLQRIATYEIGVVEHRPADGEPTTFLNLGIEATDPGGAGDVIEARVRWRDQEYPMESQGAGRFRFASDSLPALGDAASVTIQVKDRAGHTVRRDLPLQQVLRRPPEPDLQAAAESAARPEDLRFAWTPVAGAQGIGYRIEIGRALLDGGWQSLFGEEAAIDSRELIVPRRRVLAALVGMPKAASFGVRYVAWREVLLPQRDGVLRSVAIAEVRLLPGDPLFHELFGGRDLGAWVKGLEKGAAELSDAQRTTLMREFWEKRGDEALPMLFFLLLSRSGTSRYWVAQMLCDVAPRQAVTDGFRSAFPGAEQRRLLKLLRDAQAREPAAYPPGFPALLTDLEAALGPAPGGMRDALEGMGRRLPPGNRGGRRGFGEGQPAGDVPPPGGRPPPESR